MGLEVISIKSAPYGRKDMDFAGFLFGNVNEEGELEDEEVLDKVSFCLSLSVELYESFRIVLLD